MSIEKSALTAERWRDIASALANALEETLGWLEPPHPTDAAAALAEFQSAADEDDPE